MFHSLLAHPIYSYLLGTKRSFFRWLVSKGEVDKAITILKKFERINKKQVPDSIYSEFQVSRHKRKDHQSIHKYFTNWMDEVFCQLHIFNNTGGFVMTAIFDNLIEHIRPRKTFKWTYSVQKRCFPSPSLHLFLFHEQFYQIIRNFT